MINLFLNFKNSHIDKRIVMTDKEIVFKFEQNKVKDFTMSFDEFDAMIQIYNKNKK